MISLESFSFVFTAASALGTVVAAVAAWQAAKATSQVAEGQLYSTYYTEYGTPEMLRALRRLRQFREEHGEHFALKWKQALDQGEEWAHQVDLARRAVKVYFVRAHRLYETGYASKKFLRAVATVDGLSVLFEIIEPLEYALNPVYDAQRFESLRRLCAPVGRADSSCRSDNPVS
ncbi:MAG TPA: hypothetical protein VF584_16135 [Longimicrobium sp.]|jgi:hypothetical protein